MTEQKQKKAEPRVRYGMIGGGVGSWIGEAHRKACRLDDRIELVAACFSSDAKRSEEYAAALLPAPVRLYASAAAMAEAEQKLDADKRIQFVVIVTPNKHHFAVAKTFLEAGFHVVCDKPATDTLEQAKELQALVKKTGLLFALTHTYSGYPMVKEARSIVTGGKLGKVRRVMVEYPQGWLMPPGQADGRISTSMGISTLVDVGTHAEHMVRYVTGLEIEQVFADITTFVGGRRDPDDFSVLMRFKGGAKGVLLASQICTGEENPFRIRVYGDHGSIEWVQDDPNRMTVHYRDQPAQLLTVGLRNKYLSPIALHNTRLPAGHPEGYFEAFANIYVNFARAVAAVAKGDKPHEFDLDFPTIEDGVASLQFVAKVEESFKKETWARL